ncbi:hypothetical protein SUDANB121_02989 [Nocardiopsis dassonvillei]
MEEDPRDEDEEQGRPEGEHPLLPPGLEPAFTVFLMTALVGAGSPVAYGPPEEVVPCGAGTGTAPGRDREPASFSVPGACALAAGAVGTALVVRPGHVRRRVARGR